MSGGCQRTSPRNGPDQGIDVIVSGWACWRGPRREEGVRSLPPAHVELALRARGHPQPKPFPFGSGRPLVGSWGSTSVTEQRHVWCMPAMCIFVLQSRTGCRVCSRLADRSGPLWRRVPAGQMWRRDPDRFLPPGIPFGGCLKYWFSEIFGGESGGSQAWQSWVGILRP